LEGAPPQRASRLTAVFSLANRGGYFYTLTPSRVVDTRNPEGRLVVPSLQRQALRTFAVTGLPCGLPTTATSLSINVTLLLQPSRSDDCIRGQPARGAARPEGPGLDADLQSRRDRLSLALPAKAKSITFGLVNASGGGGPERSPVAALRSAAA
jgi:hypothetical protein